MDGKGIRRVAVRGLLALVLLSAPHGLAAGTKAVSPGISLGAEPQSIEGFFSSLWVPRATSERFTELFARHRLELNRILDENPFLVWDTLAIGWEALPALQSLKETHGVLTVDSQLYARAEALFAQVSALSSPELAKDFNAAHDYLDRRMRQNERQQVIIDLN